MHCHCGTNNRAPRWTFTDPCKPEVYSYMYVRRLSVSVCVSVYLSVRQSHFLVVTLGYVSQGTSVFLGILQFWCVIWTLCLYKTIYKKSKHKTSSESRDIDKTTMFHDPVRHFPLTRCELMSPNTYL